MDAARLYRARRMPRESHHACCSIESCIATGAARLRCCISGRPARGLVNTWHMTVDQPDRPAVPAYPYAYDLAKQLHAAASQQGDHSYGAFWAGSNVAQIRELEAADLINQLVLELSQAQ